MLSHLTEGGKYLTLLATHTLAAAETAATTTPILDLAGMNYLAVQAKFVRVGGGTSADFWIQTTLDNGTTWIDIMEFSFATTTATKASAVVSTTALAAAVTPGDAALGANLILSGLLGSKLRVKYTTVGTYTGASSITITAVVKA